MSKSSLSYICAILSKGIIYYTEYWSHPLNHWIVVSSDKYNHLGKQFKRDYEKWRLNLKCSKSNLRYIQNGSIIIYKDINCTHNNIIKSQRLKLIRRMNITYNKATKLNVFN
eukprot:221181_1